MRVRVSLCVRDGVACALEAEKGLWRIPHGRAGGKRNKQTNTTDRYCSRGRSRYDPYNRRR